MMIDKGLYTLPQGTASEEPDLEISIEDPEDSQSSADGVTVDLDPNGSKEDTADFDANLAEHLSDEILIKLSTELLEDVDNDVNSRKDWAETLVKGIKLLGLKDEERSEPWEGASGVFNPLLTEAVVRFQAEVVQETLPASGPVKTQIIGKETPDKVKAAERVQEDMNFRLTQEMIEYRPEHEKLAWSLPIAGSAFKKVSFDRSLGRQVAKFVPAEDIIVPYGAECLETAERVTHVMRKTKNELRKLQYSGFYRDIDLGDPADFADDIEKMKAEEQGMAMDMDNRFRVYEIQCELDLEGYEDRDENDKVTGIALPYIVTVERATAKVLAVYRNWLEDDPLKLKRKHFVHYTYIPGFGFYGFGLLHLVGGHARAATSLTRQLIDAGTLSNLPGGFKTKGLRIKGDDTPHAPGEWKDVDVGSDKLKDNFMALPYKEPSQVLMALLDKVAEDGRRFANTADMNVSDMSAQAPVGTTLALLERQLKVMSAVQARVHYSMRQELTLLAGIIRDYTPDSYEYEVDGAAPQVKQSDYDHVDILPVSDPNAATMSQKIVQFQAVLQMSTQVGPGIFDMPVLCREMVKVLGVKNAEKLVPLPDDKTSKPKDPVSENMAVLTGKPVKAFMHQDHQAHIAVHMAALQDPKIQQMLANNPQAQSIAAAAMAHINEHMAFEYRKQIEQQLGIQLPPEDEELPPEIEAQVAQMSARAAQQLLQKNQSEAAQQKAQQQAQDPLIQMQQAELQLKAQDSQVKAEKIKADTAIAQAKLQLDAQKAQQEAAYKEKALQVDLVKTIEGNKAKDQQAKMQVEADLINTHIDREHTSHESRQDREHQKEVTRMQAQAAKEAAAAKPTPKGEQ